jgi:hypothetical protein
MTSKKTIVLNANKQKQLVDLNGSIHNFDISLQAKSKNKTDFYAIVVDQDTLNNNQNLDFKKTVLGEISASFIVDTNYNKSSYFLCLYADEQCEVDIIINIKEIPMKEIPIKEKPVLQNLSHFYDKKMSEPQKNHFHEKSKSSRLTIIFISILVGAMLVYGLYYIYKKKMQSSPVELASFPSVNVIESLSDNNFGKRLQEIIQS